MRTVSGHCWRISGIALLAAALFMGGAVIGAHWTALRALVTGPPSHETARAHGPAIVTITDLNDGGQYHWLPAKKAIHVPGGSPTWQDRVYVRVVVAPDGSVVSAEPVSGPAQYRSRAATLAGDWRFIPFQRGGRKIFARVTAWVDILPRERRPDYRMPFPEIRDWNSLKITFERSQCEGSCPDYTVTIHGDGRVDYTGKLFVAILGNHHATLPHAAIQQIVEQFHKAEFFWLFDNYADSIDDSSQDVSIAFDGRAKSVYESEGETVGLPTAVRNLEDDIDRLSGVERWTKGNAETAPSLVAEGWDFHSTSCENRAMVMGVAQYGTAQAMRDLLADGAPVAQGCRKGDFRYGGPSEFEAAASRGNDEMVNLLAATGAFHNPGTFSSAFVLAAAAGNLATLTSVRSAIPFGTGGYKSVPGDDALRAGAGSCNPQVVQFILDTTTIANINGASDDGDTALLKAASTVDDKDKNGPGVRCDLTIKILLKAGASVNARDQMGFTALSFAQKNPEITRILIAAGANVNSKDNSGETPLMASWDPRVTQLLLEAGADPAVRDAQGHTALEDAEKDKRPALRACARVIRAWIAAHPKTVHAL